VDFPEDYAAQVDCLVELSDEFPCFFNRKCPLLHRFENTPVGKRRTAENEDPKARNSLEMQTAASTCSDNTSIAIKCSRCCHQLGMEYHTQVVVFTAASLDMRD
jgi:hypothetical protein